MAVTTEQVIDFLKTQGSLRVGDSPWPSLDDDHVEFHVDWDRLFPPSRPSRDGAVWEVSDGDWEPQFDDDFMGIIIDAIERGRPSDRHHNTILDDTVPFDWDVCAWYQPIHYHGYGWGIFIKEQCAMTQAACIARFLELPYTPSGHSLRRLAKALLRGAVYAYFLHEQYHHKVECLGLRLHVVDRTSRYLPYHALVYRAASGTDDQLEEALANANMYQRIGDAPYKDWVTKPVLKALRKYLAWSFQFAPPGYRCATDYLGVWEFNEAENILQGQVKEATLTPAQPASDWEMAPRMMQSFFSVTSNIWSVVPGGRKSVLPSWPVQTGVTCSTAAMIKLYQQAGYEVVSGGKGSHIKLRKPGAPTMTLPGNRKELSIGVVQTALHVLGTHRLQDLPRLLASF